MFIIICFILIFLRVFSKNSNIKPRSVLSNSHVATTVWFPGVCIICYCCFCGPPEMCGLQTRPQTDVDPPRFLDQNAIDGGISSRRPLGRYRNWWMVLLCDVPRGCTAKGSFSVFSTRICYRGQFLRNLLQEHKQVRPRLSAAVIRRRISESCCTDDVKFLLWRFFRSSFISVEWLKLESSNFAHCEAMWSVGLAITQTYCKCSVTWHILNSWAIMSK